MPTGVVNENVTRPRGLTPEKWTSDQKVAGSSPAGCTSFKSAPGAGFLIDRHFQALPGQNRPARALNGEQLTLTWIHSVRVALPYSLGVATHHEVAILSHSASARPPTPQISQTSPTAAFARFLWRESLDLNPFVQFGRWLDDARKVVSQPVRGSPCFWRCE